MHSAVLQLRVCAARSMVTATLTHGSYAITGGLGGLGLRSAARLPHLTALGTVSEGRRAGSVNRVTWEREFTRPHKLARAGPALFRR